MPKQFDIASHTLIQRIDNNSASKLSFNMWCTPSFRPSEITTRNEQNPKHTNKPTQTQKEARRSLKLLSLGSSFETSQLVAHVPSSFIFSHHIGWINCLFHSLSHRMEASSSENVFDSEKMRKGDVKAIHNHLSTNTLTETSTY